MKPLRARFRKPAAPANTLRRRLEALDDRIAPAVMSVSDATATEGGVSLRLLDRFVHEGSGGLLSANGSAFGPDGNGDGVQDLYVASRASDAILRYNGLTGAFIDTFVPSGRGGLDNPMSLAFGPGGSLYVSGEFTGKVFQYDASGSSLGVPISGLSLEPNGALGLTFGDDGCLYIANSGADEVLRYDGSTVSPFVLAGSGTLDCPRNAVFGPDGNGDGARDLYVSSQNNNKVLRYDGLTGAFLDTFATTDLFPGESYGPMWLGFGTDGYLYTTLRPRGWFMSIVRYDATTGAYVDSLDLNREGWSFAIGPQNTLYVSSNASGAFVERFGTSRFAAFSVTLDSASATPVTVSYATTDGTAVAGSDYVAASGALTFAPGQTSRTILVECLNDGVTEPDESFAITLSSPVGATLARGQGAGTIRNAGATKFFVANDGAADRTYEYGAPGTSIGSTSLYTGNTAPRGAASTDGGTRVWVVDANGTVYVYAAGGALLGSWRATGLAANATIEGITVNGTQSADGRDVWILTNSASKATVYRYSKASTLLSGSQGAAGSINLNSGNKNAKDLVTDGTSIWVVDDGSTDKVFKYTMSGSLQGSWTISGGGGSPTGITLDPSNSQQHLWVVDNATDRVYQYDNARARTSGSQPSAVTFALAAGNTNPQGIADPPVAPPAGLVSWWTGDDTANDLTMRNNATMFNGAAFAPGMVGQALTFDGIDDRAQLPDADSLKLTHSLTIEAWVLVRSIRTGAPLNHQIFFRGDDRASLDPYYLAVRTGGTVRFHLGSLTANEDLEAVIPVGRFVHVAATLDGATGRMRVYLDGTLAAERVTAVRPLRDLDPGSNPGIGIGNLGGFPSSPNNQPFDGLVDELSVYDRALTAEEVQGIFAAGTDGKIKSPVAVAGAVVNGGAAQRSRVTDLAVTFTLPVTFATTPAAAFTLARTADGAAVNFTATVTVSGGVTVVTLSNFGGSATQFGSLADGRYTLTALASQISAGGRTLDGNGDGLVGDDYALDGTAANGLFRLYGDANGDGFVNAFDFGQFRGAFGTSSGQAGYLAFLDVDGDGFINAFDFAQFRTRFGAGVP